MALYNVNQQLIASNKNINPTFVNQRSNIINAGPFCLLIKLVRQFVPIIVVVLSNLSDILVLDCLLEAQDEVFNLIWDLVSLLLNLLAPTQFVVSHDQSLPN